MERAPRVARGLTATAVLVVLLVGVPVLLARFVGWPLPRAVPSWDDVASTFGGEAPLEADTVWKALACVVWLAWLQLVAATVIEGAAFVRGGVAAPIRGLAHMQGLAGPLLTAVAMLLPNSLESASNGAAPPIGTARVLVAHSEVESPPPATAAQDDSSPTPSAEPAVLEHVVTRRDTLWDLAERYLAPGGTSAEVGVAVQRLFDLNVGLVQPDGAVLSDASLIRAGWVIRIPITADSALPTTSTSSVTVRPGDSLWEIAEDHLGDGDRYPEVFDLNVGRPQPDGEALTEPRHIEPGWTLELPTALAEPAVPAPPVAPAPPTPPATPPPPASPATAPPPTSMPVPSTTHAPPSETTATPRLDDTAPDAESPAFGATNDDEASDEVGGLGVLGVGGALLGTGLAAFLAVRRRRQLADRQPGTAPPSMPQSAAEIVDALAAVDIDHSIGVDRRLRTLGHSLGSRSSVPIPIIATLDGPSIDLLLDRTDGEPPEPWCAVADGRIWRAPVAARADDSDAGLAWLPTLVSVGALETGGLLLNLEAVGAIGVVGDTAAYALARSIVAELSMTRVADIASVHVVANVVGDVTSLPRTQGHDDVDEALAAATEDTAPISGALAGTGTPSAIELRCRSSEEAWPPAVIVAPVEEMSPDALAHLISRCSEHAGIAAVLVGGCPPGALEVRVSDAEVSIPALGLSCEPQQLTQDALDAIEEVLDVAGATCVDPDDDAPLTLFTPAEVGEVADVGAEGPPRLHLYTLGPVHVEGAEVSPQQLALVSYLALHPEATADALRDAVWGGKPPTRQRFLNTMHELRRVVGVEVLPSSTDGRYRLRASWCDAAEFDRLVAAEKSDPRERVANLRAALELVAGPPLTFESRHRRHFKWIDLGNHASRWEAIVADAAHDLAQLALDEGDVDLARWAAERGLLASPASQILTCDLVSAHLAAGDRNAAEHVADEYGRVLEDIGCDETPDALQALLESRRAS